MERAEMGSGYNILVATAKVEIRADLLRVFPQVNGYNLEL